MSEVWNEFWSFRLTLSYTLSPSQSGHVGTHLPLNQFVSTIPMLVSEIAYTTSIEVPTVTTMHTYETESPSHLPCL